MSFLIVRDDLSVVEAEFIRPREWIESLGLAKGARLDLAVPELEIDGLAEVTAVRDCPPIAEGEGRVVTGRFVTRAVVNVITVTLANGTEIRATDVHAVWSVDREEWIPAGELEPGKRVDTLEGPVAVVSVERLESPLDVHNIEVHGEHVFRVTADGVLVHNACPVGPDTIPIMLTSRVKDALGDSISSKSTIWAYSVHDHHWYPLWLGGSASGPTLKIRGLEHIRDLEPSLFEHMKQAIGGLTQKNATNVARLLSRGGLTQDDITAALLDFYRDRFANIPVDTIITILQQGLGSCV